MIKYIRFFFFLLVLLNFFLLLVIYHKNDEKPYQPAKIIPLPQGVVQKTADNSLTDKELKELQDEIELDLKKVKIAIFPKEEPEYKIAIVVDDLGYSFEKAAELLKISRNFTFSILPYTPYSKKIELLAINQGMEVMLHLPMESHDFEQNSEKGTLFTKMPMKALQVSFQTSLMELPYASGVNNHKGSMFSTNKEALSNLFYLLKVERLFYLDSKTTPESLARTVAKEINIPFLERAVFLDHIETEQAIEREFDKLIKLAKRKKKVIAICHPYDTTINFLRKRFSQLEKEKIFLFPISRLL